MKAMYSKHEMNQYLLMCSSELKGVCLQGRDGKVVQVYRKRWVIHIERLTREKVNGATAASFTPVSQHQHHIKWPANVSCVG
jgi:ribosomal protein L24